MVSYSKSPVEKLTAFENIKNCHIFHLNVITQWGGSINDSNQLPLPQHIAEHIAEHLTRSCIFSHLFVISLMFFAVTLKQTKWLNAQALGLIFTSNWNEEK